MTEFAAIGWSLAVVLLVELIYARNMRKIYESAYESMLGHCKTWEKIHADTAETLNDWRRLYEDAIRDKR